MMISASLGHCLWRHWHIAALNGQHAARSFAKPDGFVHRRCGTLAPRPRFARFEREVLAIAYPKPDSIPPVVNTRKAACDKRGLPADTSNMISSACSAPIRAPMRSPCSSAGRPARRAKPIQPARRQVGVQSTFVAHHRHGCPHDAESHDPDSELGSVLMVLNAMVA